MSPDDAGTRLILLHQHSTSARTRFLCDRHGRTCLFEPLPENARLLEECDCHAQVVVRHPAVVARWAAERLGMPESSLAIEADFRLCVSTGASHVDVFLARFTSQDPPFEAAAALGARFIELTAARGRPALELQLLRCAYEQVLG